MGRRVITLGSLALCLSVAAPRDASAACPPCTVSQLLADTAGNAPVGSGLGQSFVACRTGAVTEIFVAGATASTVTLGLQAGVGVDAPTYTQSVDLAAGDNTIPLATPFPVSAGSTYSFVLTTTTLPLALSVDGSDSYPDGTAFRQEPGNPPTVLAGDLTFEVTCGPPTCQLTQPLETGGFGANAPGGVGQSFVACADGSILSVWVLVNSQSVTPVTFGVQEGLGVSAPVYTQAATLSPGDNAITLTSPFPVTDGVEYSFAVFADSGAFGLRSASGDPYPDGTFFFQELGAIPTFLAGDPDLRFTVNVATCVATTGAPLPAAGAPFPTQAFPNPARDEVTIRFDLASPMRAKVQIFTVEGALVTEVANRFWAAGTREVRWSPSEVAAGVYFYRVATPERTTGGRIVLRP